MLSDMSDGGDGMICRFIGHYWYARRSGRPGSLEVWVRTRVVDLINFSIAKRDQNNGKACVASISRAIFGQIRWQVRRCRSISPQIATIESSTSYIDCSSTETR